MQQSVGNVGLLLQPDENAVLFNRGARQAPFAPRSAAPIAAPEGVTLCVPGAVLAPAPTAAATGLVAKIDDSPVFVDDSGTRKRLLRIAGVLVGLLSISFLGIVGVALAVPSVATSVGLGDAVPFVVPGAAAPPPAKAPVAPQAQEAQDEPQPTVVAAPKPKPVVQAPAPEAAPVTEAPVTEAPVTEAPVTEAPAPDATEGHTGQPDGHAGQTGDQTSQTDEHAGQTGDQAGHTGQPGGHTAQAGGQAGEAGQSDQQAQPEPNPPVADANAEAQ